MQVAGAPLLATKLYIPPARPNRVARPRLVGRLNSQRPLTLIAAPAGFGKTTLLSEWIPQSQHCVTWLSLDDADNDPARFWAYLIAALHKLRPDLGNAALALLQSPQPPPITAIVTTLINEIAAFPDRFTLVLEDYHVITAQPIHEALTFLLDHLPPQMRLVITTRVDPPLSLARLRARDQLTEVRADELRFTSGEAVTFLNQVMGLSLTIDDVTALEARTEGWIAGLQLAALAMRDRADMAGFITSFTGSHRYIVSYLIEEVLNRQPESVQLFLLQTSILDRLTAALCAAVAPGPPTSAGKAERDAQAMLERLEQANLFLIPLDDERLWYRYHNLFGEVLRSRLQATQADHMPELHLRASEWFEHNALVPEAIYHALAAKDWERGTRLILQAAETTAFVHGNVNIMLGWLQALPEAVTRSQPRLTLARAWLLLNAGSIDLAEQHLHNAEQALSGLEAERVQLLQGEVAALRAMVASYRREVAHTIELCRQARELLPDTALFLRAAVANALGLAYRFSGRVVEACQVFEESIALSRTAHNVFIMMDSVANLASMQVVRGQLRAAALTCQTALTYADEQARSSGYPLFDAGFPHIRLGAVLCEWNDLESAAQHVLQGIELGRQGGNLDIAQTGMVVLSRIRQAQNDAAGAREAIQTVEQIQQKFNNPMVASATAALSARLALIHGNLDAAQHWEQEYANLVSPDSVYSHEWAQLTLARLRLAEHRPVEALELLEQLEQAAVVGDRTGSLIEILALRALALQEQGNAATALTAVDRALSLAEPEGYIRVFVDEGESMRDVISNWKLETASQKDLTKVQSRLMAYADKLLEAFTNNAPQLPVTNQRANSPVHQTALIEPLSARELEVLHLVADGLSNREIASRLFITINTVKKHTRLMFDKMDVANRTQAVARARELGLL